MQVELILNPQAKGYEKLQADVKAQLAEFKDLAYRRVEQPPPAGVLSAEHEIVKFVFQHPEIAVGGVVLATWVVRLATVIVQTVRAVVERRGIESDPKNPIAILVVDNRTLVLPSPPVKEQRFLRTLEATSKPSRAKQPDAGKKQPRSKGARRR